MAEVIGLASGLVALATFALKSSNKLYQTVRSFKHHSETVLDLIKELEALQGALTSLTKTLDGTVNADLSALNIPLQRCGNACREFEEKLLGCVSQSGSIRANFRGWGNLKYLGDDVDGFRRMLAGYKSTIIITLTDATLRTSSVSAQKFEEHRNMVEVAVVTFEDRLAAIDAKLDSIFERTVKDSGEGATELRQIKEERTSTQKCLLICARASGQLDEIRLPSTRGDSDPAGLIDPVRTVGDGIQGCKDTLSSMTAVLEKNMSVLIDKMVKESKPATSGEEDSATPSQLQAEWESLRKCWQIASQASSHLNGGTFGIIDNFATGNDAIQLLVSTNNMPIRGQNRGYGERPRQLGGYMSDESLQRVSDNMMRPGLYDHVATASTSQAPTGGPVRPGASFQGDGSGAHKPVSKPSQEEELGTPGTKKHARSGPPEESELNPPGANRSAKRSSPGL